MTLLRYYDLPLKPLPFLLKLLYLSLLSLLYRSQTTSHPFLYSHRVQVKTILRIVAVCKKNIYIWYYLIKGSWDTSDIRTRSLSQRIVESKNSRIFVAGQYLMTLHSSCTLSFRGRCNIWCSSTVTFRGRRNIWWSCTFSLPGRCSIWCSSTVTFRGSGSTWWNVEW